MIVKPRIEEERSITGGIAETLSQVRPHKQWSQFRHHIRMSNAAGSSSNIRPLSPARAFSERPRRTLTPKSKSIHRGRLGCPTPMWGRPAAACHSAPCMHPTSEPVTVPHACIPPPTPSELLRSDMQHPPNNNYHHAMLAGLSRSAFIPVSSTSTVSG